jgi:hypothetical protein
MTRSHRLPHRSAGRLAFCAWRDRGFIVASLLLVVTGFSGGCAGAPKPGSTLTAKVPGAPKAEVLIRKMIDATGGKAAYQKRQSMFTAGWVRVPKAKVVLKHTAWAQRPNKSYDLMEAPAFGKIESGCNGSTVWEISEDGGPRLKTGSDRATLLWEADFDNWLNWKKYYKSATTVGVDTVAGQAAWKVELVPLEGPPEMKWMDQATGLLLKTTARRQTQRGELSVEIFYDGYRETCGMKIPFRTREVPGAGMPEIVATIDSVACNPSVPEGRFDLSDEIKAIVETEKAREALEQQFREAPADPLARDYLTIVVFALNRASGGLRGPGRPALARHGLDRTRVSADISADGFTMVPTSMGTGIVFGSAWADPLPKILGKRGDFPAMSFRNGSADIQEQAGLQTLRVAEGTEMQFQEKIWAFQQGKWSLARSEK